MGCSVRWNLPRSLPLKGHSVAIYLLWSTRCGELLIDICLVLFHSSVLYIKGEQSLCELPSTLTSHLTPLQEFPVE